MTHNEIVDFVEQVKPELDSPGVYVPMINQYLTRQEQWNPEGIDPTRVCYVMPVPEDMAIQNIGMGILLRIINEDMGPEFIGSIHYFPENKMLKRMRKAGVPLFDNWLFHALSDYDILGFSSYYSLQYLNMIPMFRLAGIPYLFEDRKNDWDQPVIVLGGIQSYSAEPITPLFDAYLIGEGEEMNRKFFELYRKRKQDGTSKIDFLYEAARDIQGVYLPWAYEFTYFPSDDPDHPNQIKEYHLTPEAKEKGVPLKVLKAVIEFRNTPPLTKSLVSNGVGGAMTIGSLFCANSCSNLCSFCQGSQLTLPYREIPFNVAKKSAIDIVKNTGTGVVTPYSFNASDLSYINRFTADVLTEQNTRVSLSSERLDTIDDDFVKATIKSGSSSFTVAIESASARGRHILNKNLTEDQILRAFDVMIRNGATKIKIYNISSWPFETEEDREYYAVLMKKIIDIRNSYGAKTYIRLSFTPFNPKPHTILQWSTQNDIALDDDGNPYMVRSYDAMMPLVYRATNDSVSFRFGTTTTVTIVAYCLNYGDRRLFPVIEAMANDPDVKYLGGMGIGSQGADAFIKHLRNLTVLDLPYFLREHSADEVFPWEAISNGIDKSWLRMFYEKAYKASKTPLTQEGSLRKPCYEACTYCGVCRSLDKSRGNHGDSRNDDGSINESYWDPAIYGKGRFLPIFAYGDNSGDHIGIEDKIEKYLKPKKYKVMRFECDINPYYRYVDTQKLKYRLRRACLRAGVPISANVVAASDKILMKAYFSGKELYEVYLTDVAFNLPESQVIEMINSEIDDSMKVTKVDYYSKAVKQLKKNFDYVLYSLTLPSETFSIDACTKEIEVYEKADFYPVKIKQKAKGKMGVLEVVTRNAKEMSYQCFNKDNGDGTWTLFAALSDNLSIYEFAEAILHTAKRNLYRYPTIIEEFLLKATMGSSFDMFAPSCDVCGAEIETNIWGEPVDTCKCMKHKYISSFVHRDVDVSNNSEDYLSESDEDDYARFEQTELTMDDDTDLEDFVLKKAGTTSA